MREPLDGPVLAVIAVDSVEQAIALANDSEYGLGASVWTADRYRGTRIARELHAGMVWLTTTCPRRRSRADRGAPPPAAASARRSARPGCARARRRS